MLEQGPSRSTNLMDWTVIWAKNKQYLEPLVPRYVAVNAENLAMVTIVNGPETPYA